MGHFTVPDTKKKKNQVSRGLCLRKELGFKKNCVYKKDGNMT